MLDENKDGHITIKEKMDNGQVVYLTAHRYDSLDRKYYFISLFINKRGRGYEELKQTGKNGLRGLFIAKSLLKQLIHQIKMIDGKITIVIYADDSRRLRIYKRYLQDLGFIESYWYRKCLRKEVK